MTPRAALLVINQSADADTDWMGDSKCSDKAIDPDIWFNNVPMARLICSLCPVQDFCLAHALERETEGEVLLGVWGGLSRIQRQRLRDSPGSLTMMRKVRRPRPQLTCTAC
jgi:hypothetical protein